MSTDKSKNSEKKPSKQQEIAQKFIQFVDYLIGCLLPEKPNELDLKEGEYLCKYSSERFAETLNQYETFKRIPIFQLVIYAGNDGRCNVSMVASPEPEILTNFRLPELGKGLKEAIDKWDLSLDEPPKPKADLTAYSAIQEHIDKGEK